MFCRFAADTVLNGIVIFIFRKTYFACFVHLVLFYLHQNKVEIYKSNSNNNIKVWSMSANLELCTVIGFTSSNFII